jgi:DNA-binding transcriptional LysR family regulator
MFDFRLEVFYTVAKRLSLTKAAAELFITQPIEHSFNLISL